MRLKIEVEVFQTVLKQRRTTISFLTSSWVCDSTSLKHDKIQNVYDNNFILLAQSENSSFQMSVQ
jgi:hypothetical protein